VGVAVKGFYMGKERDETGLVRAACWRLGGVKGSYSCAPICEGWGRIGGWGGEGGTTMTVKVSGWLMRALPTSLLTGTVTSGAR